VRSAWKSVRQADHQRNKNIERKNKIHERRFNREIERLRDPERIARLEVTRVVDLSLEGLTQPSTALDLGTGSGLFAEQFVIKGLTVTGLDANPGMLPVAQQFVPSGIFQEGTAENLPFLNGSFDLVFMGLLLHETDDILAALSEAYRVVRHRLAVLEWRDEEQSFGPPREHRIPVNNLKQLAKQAGFKIFRYVKLTNLALYLIDKLQ
jgi:ubiquinone/menaquinone biosynthesis C-methylase UbiE